MLLPYADARQLINEMLETFPPSRPHIFASVSAVPSCQTSELLHEHHSELIGFALTLHAFWTLAVGMPLYLIPLFVRISQEEKAMRVHFPQY